VSSKLPIWFNAFDHSNIWKLCTGAFILSWCSLLTRTSLWWNEASYYTHGWCVPLLALILLERRKNMHPRPASPLKILFGLHIVLLVLYTGARLIAEPDPFWRLPLWIELLLLSILTGFFLNESPYHIPWKTWMPCAIYLFTCLPWPAGIESSTVHTLTKVVTNWTAEALLWAGHPAEVLDRAILVDQRIVAIDQACSGIRSLQNLISFTLFFSLYFRHQFLGFTITALSAIFLSVFFNFIRAFLLSWVFLEYDQHTQTAWHDFIGNTVITCSMGTLALIASSFSKKEYKNKLQSKVLITSSKPIRIASPIFLPYGFTLIACQGLVFLWFGFGVKTDTAFSWQAVPFAEEEKIPEDIQKTLLFDYGWQMKLNHGSYPKVEVMHFGYEEDSAAASLCSRNHPPDYCMGYTGIELIDHSSLVEYEFDGQKLGFRHYSASKQSDQVSNLHVFWGSFTLDGRIKPYEFSSPGIWEKFKWFISGKLSYQRKVLLIGINGTANDQQAIESLREILRKVIQKSN